MSDIVIGISSIILGFVISDSPIKRYQPTGQMRVALDPNSVDVTFTDPLVGCLGAPQSTTE